MVEQYSIGAGAVMSATGLLSKVTLLTPTGDVFKSEGSYIISSCTGTAAMDKIQLKVVVMTQTGESLTGEVLDGCVVADSVEIVLAAIDSSATRP